MSINEDDFETYSFDSFKKQFLIEKALDPSPLRLGEVSRNLSRINIDSAKTLDKWSAKIISDVNRYIKKKKTDTKISIRKIPVGDIKTGQGSVILLTINGLVTKASIFDDNRISISMPNNIARIVNKGNTKKFLKNKDKVADYLIGIIEVVA